jgi:hypothetical protein
MHDNLLHGTRLSAVMTDIWNNRLSLCLLHELTPACYTALVFTRGFYGRKWKNKTGPCARAMFDLSKKVAVSNLTRGMKVWPRFSCTVLFFVGKGLAMRLATM